MRSSDGPIDFLLVHLADHCIALYCSHADTLGEDEIPVGVPIRWVHPFQSSYTPRKAQSNHYHLPAAHQLLSGIPSQMLRPPKDSLKKPTAATKANCTPTSRKVIPAQKEMMLRLMTLNIPIDIYTVVILSQS